MRQDGLWVVHASQTGTAMQLAQQTAQALQRTSVGEGLLFSGDLPPVIFKQRRHYLDPGLLRLKGPRERLVGSEA